MFLMGSWVVQLLIGVDRVATAIHEQSSSTNTTTQGVEKFQRKVSLSKSIGIEIIYL